MELGMNFCKLSFDYVYYITLAVALSDMHSKP